MAVRHLKFFFLSIRRRHTRLVSDWSSDVCSSDLLPVPPGFTLTTEVCTAFYQNNRNYPNDLTSQVREGLTHLEKAVGLKFGDKRRPLLVSRSEERRVGKECRARSAAEG